MYKGWTVADIERLANNIPNVKKAFPDVDIKDIPWGVLLVHLEPLTEKEKEREFWHFYNSYAQGAFCDSEFMENAARSGNTSGEYK